jgi:hypothetical protein
VYVCVCVCVCVWVCICVCALARSECTDMYVYMFSRDLSLSLCAQRERGGHLPAVCVYLDTYAYTCESVNRFTDTHTHRQTDRQTEKQTDYYYHYCYYCYNYLLHPFHYQLWAARERAAAASPSVSAQRAEHAPAPPGGGVYWQLSAGIGSSQKNILKSQYPRTFTVKDHYRVNFFENVYQG